MPCVELHTRQPVGTPVGHRAVRLHRVVELGRRQVVGFDRQLGGGQRRLGVAALVLDRVVLEGLPLRAPGRGRRRTRAAPTRGSSAAMRLVRGLGASRAAIAATAAPPYGGSVGAAPSRRRTAGSHRGRSRRARPARRGRHPAISMPGARWRAGCAAPSPRAGRAAARRTCSGPTPTGGRRPSGGWSARRPRRAADRPATPVSSPPRPASSAPRCGPRPPPRS